jgi:hypothetical protein
VNVNDYIWDSQNGEIFSYNLTANKLVYIKNDTTNEYSLIGEITGNTSNTLTIGSITSNITINADTELFLSTNLLRINTEVNHQLNDKDDLLIYNNFNDTLLNNNKYKIYSAEGTSFNLIESSNITTTEIQAGGTTIYNVYGSEIGTCKVVTSSTTNEKTLQFDYVNNINPNDGIKINLNFGDELFNMNNSNKLTSLNLIVIDDYSKGTKNNIKIGQITNSSNTVNTIKDGKILKINSTDNLERTADLTKTDNTIQFLSTNHNLSVGDMILIYGLEDPSNDGTMITYYSRINKTKAVVSQVINDNEFVINYQNNNITETTVNTKYYKMPLTEYNLKRVSTTGSVGSQVSVFELDTYHDLLDGDQLLIYNSDKDELNNLWVVKKEDDLKIRLIFSQTFNYNINKIFSLSGTNNISGIVVKVATSSISGVNFNKYIKYSDIIKIENSDYNSADSYLSKFPKIQYRSIKKIQDTIIELDEPIIIPYRKQNIDLIKYEIPNFTNDLQLNSLVRGKIGNVYETKKIIEIINDFTLKVDTAFSSDINYYIDLNQVVYQDTEIKSQKFNLDFKKIFTFNSKTFSGKEFFEKGSTTITYNNWEKFRYYVTESDITNNVTNYDIYNYCNKLIELNNLHWSYYQENYKILKIKAFTPNVNNYTKSIPELILFINKIIYNYNDKTYNSDLEIDTIASNNYNIKYYIDDKENESQIEKVDNLLKIKTTKNINEYNSQQIKWDKKHQLKFTDFINQRFKLSDNYVKRFNKKNKITESEIMMDQYSDNNYQFNNIQGFSNGDKNIDIVERFNDSKYQIVSKPIKITELDKTYNLYSNKILDNTINKNLYLDGTNKVVIKNKKRKVLNLIKNSYNQKLIDKLYLQEEIGDISKNYNLSFVKDYNLIITRVDNQMLYFNNFSNNLDMATIVKSGDYIRFKLDDDLYVRQILRIVSSQQIELSDSLFISKYFTDQTLVKVNKQEGYVIDSTTNIQVDGANPSYYFTSGDTIFDSDGNIISVIQTFETNNNVIVGINISSDKNLVRIDDNLNLHMITKKSSQLEVFDYIKIDSIEKEMIDLSGLVSFDNTTINGINTKFISEVKVGDKLLFKGHDLEVEILEIEKLDTNQYTISLDQDLILDRSYVLEEKLVKSIQKIGINKYILFLNSDIVIDANQKYILHYTDKNYEERLVTNITNDTQLTIDKSPKINKFLDKTIFELKKHDSAKSKNIGGNLNFTSNYFEYSDAKDNLAIGNMLKIVLANANQDYIYFRIVKNIETNNRVYFDKSIDISFQAAQTKSVDLIQYYAYTINLNQDYPKNNFQLLSCTVDINQNSYQIASSNSSLFINKLKIGDKLILKNDNKDYDLTVVNLFSDKNTKTEIITVDKIIEEDITKEDILYRVNNINLETPYDYQIDKESKSLLLTGTVDVVNNSRNVINGTNTLFKSEVKIGDYIMINFNKNYDYGIVSEVINDTQIIINHQFKFTGSNLKISKYLISPPIELSGRTNINNTNLIEGINTKFLEELKLNDNILIEINQVKFIRKITYVYNDNLIEVDSVISASITNLAIQKINKISGYQLEIDNNLQRNFNLNIQVTAIDTTNKILTVNKDISNILSYGDNLVNSNRLYLGMITNITTNTITLDQIKHTINQNDYIYLPNMIEISNSSLKIGSTLKFNNNQIGTITKNILFNQKIKTGLFVDSTPILADGITTIVFKIVNVNYFVKKGSILLNSNNQIIGVVNSINMLNNNIQTILNPGITVVQDQEIFVDNPKNYLFLEKPLLELSTFTVNGTGTYNGGLLSSIDVNNTDSNVKIGSNIYDESGLFLGEVSSITGTTTLNLNNGSSVTLIDNQNLYYEFTNINSVEEIQNCIIESNATITSNSEEIEFSNSYKPNLDIDDKIIINDSVICKVNQISDRKITLNKQINLTSNSYPIKKIEKSLVSIVLEKEIGNEYKYFDMDYADLSKNTYIGNIIYRDILDLSSNAKYYYNSVYPIANLYSGSKGFISTSENEFDVFPLERTSRFDNKTSATSSNNIINFKYVQLELSEFHHLEEFFNYNKEPSFSSKLIESKTYNINNINFVNSNILNNWKKIIDVKIETTQPEEIELDLSSKFSLNKTNNLVNKISNIKLTYSISNIKVTNNQITAINANILSISGNILGDYQIGTAIFKSGSYVGKVTEVTNSTITLDSVANLAINDNLEVSSLKSADNSNRIYSIRSDIFDYDFNPEYSYKISTYNQYNNLVNQYIISNLEKLKNVNEIKFYSPSVLSEIDFKDSTLNSSSFINDDIKIVFETINNYQIELSNQAEDNNNNTLIQEKEYKIKNINQERIGINSEFTFNDTEIFNIINPTYNSYLTIDEIFDLIVQEFTLYFGKRQLYNIFNNYVKINDLILVGNLTFMKGQGSENTDLADYLTSNNNNIIILKKEKILDTFNYLKSTTSTNDKIINQDIQFITDKINPILTDLICKEKFLEQEYYKQDLIINNQLQYIQNVYSAYITNTYEFALGTFLTENELTSIKDQKTIDKDRIIYKYNQNVINISVIDKWIRVELENTIDNLEGVWSILEKDDDLNYNYYNVKFLEKRDDLVFYLEMVNKFEIDSNKTYYLESSFEVENLEKDWSSISNFILTFNSILNKNNQILALEEYNNLTDYQAQTINKVYYVDKLETKENMKFYTKLELDLNKKYRLVTTYKLSRKYLLPNQFSIDNNDNLNRRITNIGELVNNINKIDQNKYTNYLDQIKDIQEIIKFVNFDYIINYLRINKISQQLDNLVKSYIKISSNKVGSDFLFNLNKYHTYNLINYFYYYFAENCKDFNYSEVFDVKNLIDYDVINRYLLDLTQYNIEFNNIKSIRLFAFLEESNFSTSDYTNTGIDITNYYQIYTNPYHVILSLDSQIIDLQRDPYKLNIDDKYYILITLQDDTEIKVVKELFYIRDDNIKINYDIGLNDYQLITKDSNIQLNYKYLQNTKKADIEILNTNSINNVNCNLPDLINKDNKINISHTYNQTINDIKIIGYLYKFYFIKNTDIEIFNNSILTFGSNDINLLKETSDENFKIIEILSNSEFVYKEYFLLQENIYSIKSFTNQIINQTLYQDKLIVNFEEQNQEIDVNYTNYHIIKINDIFRKVFDTISDKEILIQEEDSTTIIDQPAEKIQITFVENLLFNLFQVTVNQNILIGTNTIFETQLSENDIIIINDKYVRQVTIVNSQTSITVNETLPQITITSMIKINYITTPVGNVSVENNNRVLSVTHNLGTTFYNPVLYINKIPIKTIESSYIKIHGKINKSNYNNLMITGTNTKFTTDLKVGDKIKVKTKHNHYEYRNVVTIESDNLIMIDYRVNNIVLEETNIYKLQKLLGQISISGDDYNIVDGTNTLFTKQLRVSDFIRVEVNGFDYVKKIISIDSDTKLIVEGSFNQEVTTLINYFKETNGYILDLSSNYDKKNKEIEIVEEKRLFFDSYPISEDYFALLELNFSEKLNIEESHTQEFNFVLNSYNNNLVKSYPLIYYKIATPTSYQFLVKNINLDYTLSWKLNYENVLSGFKVYPIDYANLGDLNEYVYKICVEIGLDFNNLKSGFSLSLGTNELTETDNSAKLYHQDDKKTLILIKPTIEILPIVDDYYLFVKNEFVFTQYQIVENILTISLSDKLIYYSDLDSYKHKYYIADIDDNQLVEITDIIDLKDSNYNYQITVANNYDLINNQYKIIHIRQLKIEKIETFKKDRTLDIEFTKDVHFNKKVYGETASQFLSGSNEIDFNSKIYKFDLLGNRIHNTGTYDIVRSTTNVNEIGNSLYYFDVILGTNYIDGTLQIGDSILFYDSDYIEHDPRVVEIQTLDTNTKRIFIDKINIEIDGVIIYKYSEINMKLFNTNYTIKYGNANNFDILNFYDGSGKRQLYFTSKTPLVRQSNILKIVDISSDPNQVYYRFVEKLENDGIIIEEEIGSDFIANVFYNSSESINFIDQDYNLTVTNNTTITLSKTPNSELKINDIVIIENKFIRKINTINGNVLSIDIGIENGTYYNISKLYLIEKSTDFNVNYINANKKILVNDTSTIDLDDTLTINSETDVSKNITIDPIDNYPIIRIDKDFDYLNTINTNIRLNNFIVNSITFVDHNIDGNYIKLNIQNKDDFTITKNKVYKLYKTINVIPKYKEFNGTFPLDLSFYESQSFRKHTFLINSINKRKISDNFLISYQDNIIKINNKMIENLEIYQQKILRNKQLIKPVTVSKNNLELSFIKNIGFYIINYVKIFIGEQKIDKHTGEWLDLYHQLYDDHQLDKMIGNIPELIKYNKTPKGNYRLYIPLKFWFCQKPGLALPLIALHNNTVRIEIKLNKLEDCIKFASNGILKQEGNIKVNLLAEYFYLEENERKLFAESKHEYLIERIQDRVPEIITERYNNVKIEFVDPIKDIIWVIKSQKNIDEKENTIYCDSEELIEYDTYQKEYLENLETYNKYLKSNTPIELIPNSFQDEYQIFLNLIEITLENYLREKHMKFYLLHKKEVIDVNWDYVASTNTWKSSADHNLNVNDIIMFTTSGGGATNYLENQVYYVIKIKSLTEIQLSRKYGGSEFKGTDDSLGSWNAHKINNGKELQNNAINIYKFKIKKENKEINYYHLFDKGAIKIYNRKITADKDANYYNYLQTMNYIRSPNHGIYVHNFSLYPLENQPSGSCNFSVTGDNRLEFETTDRISKENPGSLRLYSRSYNILRVMSGFGGLAFFQ